MIDVLTRHSAARAPLSMNLHAMRGDPLLTVLISVLLSLGLVVLLSASMPLAEANHGEPLYYFKRQLFHLAVAFGGGAVILMMPLSGWQNYSRLLFFVALAAVAATLIPGIGIEINGSRRWLDLGVIGVQPSEFLRTAAIVFFAARFAREIPLYSRGGNGLFFASLALLALACCLLLFEPDFGSALILSLLVLGMLFLGGCPLFRWLSVAALGLAACGSLLLVAPYRLERLTSFLDPWADMYGGGFQLIQSMIAVSRGGLSGVGLGLGLQKQLPAAPSDFLFAVYSEELGFIGVLLLLGLYAALLLRLFFGAALAKRLELPFHALLLSGVSLSLGLQMIMHVGANLVALPPKGLPLPLLSYGGSNLVASCLALALALRAVAEVRQAQVGEGGDLSGGWSSAGGSWRD